MRLIKNIALFVTLLVSLPLSVWSQGGGPTFSFTSETPCTGDDFCLDVTVEDFTDILAIKFPVTWDTSVVEFQSITNFGLPGMNLADFDLSTVNEGLIRVNWQFDDCEVATQGSTIQDDVIIFTLCFRAIGDYGAVTNVSILNQDTVLLGDPDPVNIQRFGIDCSIDIQINSVNPGVVSTCVIPVELYATSTLGNTGELVSIDVKSRGFTDLNALQFTMVWDSSILMLEEVIPLEALINLNVNNFGTPVNNINVPRGNLTFTWNYIDPTGNDLGATLVNDESVFTLNFRIIGDCETSSAVGIDLSEDALTPLEAISSREENGQVINDNIPLITTDGEVATGACTPDGLILFTDCGAPTGLDSIVCVTVSAGAINDLTDIRYLMEWNPNILEYQNINILTNSMQGLNQGSFDAANASNGLLELDWSSLSSLFNASFVEGEQLYEVCFKVVGLGGNSPVRIDPTAPAARVRREGSFIPVGLFPNNCEVEVNQPAGVTLNLSDAQAPQGDTMCVDITAANFNELVNLQFSLSWETTHAIYAGIRNINPLLADSITIDTGGIGSGSFTFLWNNTNGVTLNSDEVLFSLCLAAIGPSPGELSQNNNCQELQVVPFPLVGQAKSLASLDNDIGLTGVNGEICILNPEGFFLVVENEEGFVNFGTCIDFKVAEFDSITSAQFSLNWDATDLSFDSIVLRDFPGLEIGTNLDTSAVRTGLIRFDWTDLQSQTVADSTVLFEVCYTLIGPVNTCTDIEINSDPNPSVTTINGAGSVFPLGGGVCIKDTLIIVDSIITAVTCPDAIDGTIEVSVTGATGEPVFYNWVSLESENVPVQSGPKAVNLPVGRVAVTAFTLTNPPLVTRDTFSIPLTTVLPEANAGDDVDFNCVTDAARLEGSGSTGDIYDYRWTALSGTIASGTDNAIVLVSSPGTYVFSVINSESLCSARDTMIVRSPVIPSVNAGQDVFLTCADSSKVLDGTLSSPTDSSVSITWTAFSGGVIEAGEANVISPRVSLPGTYVLEIAFKETGCSETDTVRVESVEEFTPVSAGPDVELNCDTNGVTLFANIDNSVRDFNFSWFDENDSLIIVDDRVNVNTPGLYRIVAQDRDNFCETTDTIEVLPNSRQPVIDLIDSSALDCTNPTLDLMAVVSNTDSFTVAWQASAGGVFEQDTTDALAITATAAGVFTLTITDTTTSCITIDSVMVDNQIETISVDAGIGGDLTCEAPNLTLRSTVDTSLSLEWTLNDNPIGDQDTLAVTTAGTYFLTATNLATGCNNIDSVAVTSSADLPEITAPNLPTITCEETTVVLNAEVMPSDADYAYSWSVVDQGEIVSGENTAALTVGAAGTYLLQATNTATGCTSSNSFTVPTDTITPTAIAGDDQVLTCTQNSVSLNGVGSEVGLNIVYNWSTLEGNGMASPANQLQTTVDGPGTYMLEVRDTLTGCSSTDMVVVTPDTALPNVTLAPLTEVLTCTTNMLMLDGTGSDSGAGFSANWNALDGQLAPQTGNDPLMASVTQAGDYELVILNLATGCQSNANITVTEDRDLPMASAGEDVTVTCPGNPVSLDGSLSEQGPNLSYSWTTISGGELSNPTSLAPTVNEPGEFEIVVTDSTNGCTNSDIVLAILDPNLTVANAGMDDSSCDSLALIVAEPPLGATGLWTTTGAAIIDVADGNSTTINNLQPGPNVFVWTLSTADCPNYSSDSVTVIREQAPQANIDAVDLPVGTNQTTISVTANDIITSQSGANISIVSNPTLGAVDSVTGNTVTYRVARGIVGEDMFTYEICNNECPNLCDRATVSVNVPFDPNYSPTLANGITPNGDGQNDELRFEVLEIEPDAFPDNEIIIFNRWGDIVFQAKPYNNNWRGTNDSGQELPQGTYYYILRLDISEGNIVSGDVTIVK